MDFREYINSLQYNVIIDLPVPTIPRVRVYYLEMNPEDGVFFASELVELPALVDCHKADEVARMSRRYPVLPPHCEVENVSNLVEGLEAVATMVLEWATQYEKSLGQPLFPSPEMMATLVANQALEILMYKNGLFYFGPKQVTMTITVNQPEAEYRPGNYL